MKKKIISVLLSSVMAMSVLAGCGGSGDAEKEEPKTEDTAKENGGDEGKTESSGDTLVYWSMWESTEPQGQVIQEAVNAYSEETGVKVDLQCELP